jgi:hypothetical protein
MTSRFPAMLCAALVLSSIVPSAVLAQSAPTAESVPAGQVRTTGIVEHVDALHRQVTISGIVYRIPPLTRVAGPLSGKQSDLRTLEAGMHVEFTGEMPARPRDLGTISSIRIIAN